MAASAADVRSILNLPVPNAAAKRKAAAQQTARRGEVSIARELSALIGPGGAPSLAVQRAPKPRLKAKPRLGGGVGVKWEKREFANTARTDGLRLSHWVTAESDPAQEYSFAKYSVPSTVYTYTDEEYAQLLNNEEWSKEETDYLFAMMREYEARWFIVHDRYDFPGGTPRQLEDIKDRYCSACRKLVRHRYANDEQTRTQLLASLNFDKERETMRKKYLHALAARTPAEIAEEEALFLELKRLEQTERRYRRERDDLLRTLLGIDSGLPDLPIDDDASPVTAGGSAGVASASVSAVEKKRKRTEDSPITPISAAPRRSSQSASTKASDELNCIHRTSPPPPGAPAQKTTHQPVYLRSFRLFTPKPAVAPRVAQVLIELGVPASGKVSGPMPPGDGRGGALGQVAGVLGIGYGATTLTPRLVMPTRANCARLDGLMEQINALVELKRAAERAEQDARVCKTRLGIRAGSGEEDGMEVDAAEREGSVASGRSPSVLGDRGRGQRQRRT